MAFSKQQQAARLRPHRARSWRLRPFGRIHEPVSAPAGVPEPGERQSHRCIIVIVPIGWPPRRRHSPPSKPPAGAVPIDTTRSGKMLEPVLQDIDDCVAHLPGSRERAGMVAIVEDLPLPPQNGVDCPRETDAKPARAPRESNLVVRLGDEMNVVGLNGKVNETKSAPRTAAQSSPNLGKQDRQTQARQPTHDPQRDMHGIPRVVLGTRTMGDTLVLQEPRATRVRSPSAPLALEAELFLDGSELFPSTMSSPSNLRRHGTS
jgi:hypothetical protein